MKKYICLLFGIIVFLFSGLSQAYTPLPAPTNGFYVADPSGKMTLEQVSQLNQKIDKISKSTKNEFGILLLQDMGDDNIDDVANATYRSWGIGKRGLDNGCLIVVAIKQRKSRIETGAGVEGEVTDLQASDILKKNLNPHLKNADYFGGFNETLDALSGLMESRHNQKVAPIVYPKPVMDNNVPFSSGSGCDISNGGVGMFSGIVAIVGTFVLGILVYLHSKAVERRERIRQLNEESEELLRKKNLETKREIEERNRKMEAIRLEEARQENLKKQEIQEANRKREMDLRANLIAPMPLPEITRPSKTYSSPIRTPSFIAPTIVEPISAAKEMAARKQREKEDADRNRRAIEEADRNRRTREEEDRNRRTREEASRSSYSSSSSYDWGGSSSSGGFDSGGGGFGGGSSGGGGASSDF